MFSYFYCLFPQIYLVKTLISIIGTTGIGKTKLSIELAKHLNTEIISCDSRQFFKEMKIGTASPTAAELNDAPHHFIGQLSIHDYHSIGQFERDALNQINKLFKSHDEIILVGGSMMYEKAIIEGLNDLPEANPENQMKLKKIIENQGIESLQHLLKDLDFDYYQVVDLENPRRLLRAIDVIWQTGIAYSEIIAKPKPKRHFNVLRIGIEAPREIIYERINLRVDKMMEQGLLDEVKSLYPTFKKQPELVALQTVGYQELFNYLNKIGDLNFAVDEIKKNSRRFAKRQLTWYRKEENIHWVNYQNALQESLYLLENNNIINTN